MTLFKFRGYCRKFEADARALALEKGMAYCFCVFDGNHYVGSLGDMVKLGLYAKLPLI